MLDKNVCRGKRSSFRQATSVAGVIVTEADVRIYISLFERVIGRPIRGRLWKPIRGRYKNPVDRCDESDGLDFGRVSPGCTKNRTVIRE